MVKTEPRGTWIDESLIDHDLLLNAVGLVNQHSDIDSFIAAVPTTYLKLDASNDPITEDLELSKDLTVGIDLSILGNLYIDNIYEYTAAANITMNNHIFPGVSGGIDFGDSSNFFRTLYLSNPGGNVVLCQPVQPGGGSTNYTFNCGGGQAVGGLNQGGTFTFKMNDIASSLGTSVNQIIFDPGRPDIFQPGTTNDVIFQAYNGIATYAFVCAFGGFNDVQYGLELRRTGVESFAKTLIFDNQVPVSDFRRSIDFRINTVNKLTIENDGTIIVTDRITTPELTAGVINNGVQFGTVAVPGVNFIAYGNFFGLNWFDYLTINAVTTNLPVCLGMFPNGTAAASYVNVYNSSSTGATAWLSMGARGAIAELVVRDFAQTTNITDLNIGSGGNDFPVFDVSCTTLTDINFVFTGVIEYNFTTTAFTLSDANNIIFGTTIGSKIGTAPNQKLAFYNSTPITQPSSTGQTAGYTSIGGGTNVQETDTFTGGIGVIAYTIGDIVRHLKSLGLIAA